jgi:GH3 auxin-responsive promoter
MIRTTRTICAAANRLWLAASLPEAIRFRRGTHRVASEQTRILLNLVRANASSEFGERHRFAAIRSVRDYQDAIPLRSYDDYLDDVARVANGAPNVLTAEPVRLLEPTSGSTAATKLIPYTRTLQREFQRGIQTWIADLFVRRPDLMRGQAYWSVSPLLSAQRATAGGIPIGFEDDSAYVGGWRRRLVRATMAVPPSVKHSEDIDTFQHATLLALVRSADLRLVSVWNPTFLSLLMDRLPLRGDALLRDLGSNRARADVLRAALRTSTAAERHTTLWPNLELISCWTDGNAAQAAAVLGRLFPQAEIQPKGLIATEGFVSFPMLERDGALLAFRSHFLEFAPVDDVAQGAVLDERPRLAHELERGRRYEVILSTGGGLYRYRLHDVIEVVGHVGECPCVKFVGRAGAVSDWFGEKLNEAHVGQVLREALHVANVQSRFAMLACDSGLGPPSLAVPLNGPATARYILYIDTSHPDDLLRVVARHIDRGLRENFHYDYARRLGQLGPVGIFRARAAGDSYVAAAVTAGRRLGDVKPLALDRRSGWSERFEGRRIT